jgi:hypothetical protein
MLPIEPLTPWAEGLDEPAELEQQLAQLWAAVPEPAPISELAQRRVAVRLHAPAARGAGLMLLRLVAVGIVLGIAGAATAQWATLRFLSGQRELVMPRSRTPIAAPALVPQPTLPRARALSPAAEPELEPLAVAPLPGAAASPLPAQSSQLGLEAASLEAALSALRAGGTEHAAQALRGIDRHLREFPRGSLELEARVARVDALLVLGRRQEARRELSALPIESVGRKSELRLIRGELRADDDCRAALGDFQVLVDQALPVAWAERALFGRGACLLKLGEKAAAQRDFGRYLERFPNGRFAAQIRAQHAE